MPFFRRRKANALAPATPAPIASAKGTDGEVQLFEHTIRIDRGYEVKDIMLSTISSVQLGRVGFMRAGFLEVSFSGKSVV